jgi:O-Antigen ligase
MQIAVASAPRVRQRVPLGVVVGVAVPSAAVGVGLAARPVLVGALVGGAAVAVLLVRAVVRLRGIGVGAAFVAYLAVEGVVLSHVPPGSIAVLRLLPEAVIAASAGIVFVTRPGLVLDRLRPLLWPLVLVVGAWSMSAIVAQERATTALLGFRAELRFLPLFILAAAVAEPTRALRVWGRVLVGVAAMEGVLACGQFVAPALRSPFVETWSIRVGGAEVAAAGPPRLNTVFGTFLNYNALGAYLVLAFAVLISAELGFGRRKALGLGALIAAGLVASGSRESLIAALVAVVVVGRLRLRLPMGLIVLTAALVLVSAGVFQSSPAVSGTPTKLSERLATLVNPAQWKPDYHTNFRGYYLVSEARYTLERHPLFGAGIGSVMDTRKLRDGSSPLYDTHAGRQATAFSYQYDSNWTILLVEVGFVGTAAILVLLLGAARVARRVQHWSGVVVPTLVAQALVLSFFLPALQIRTFGAPFWLLLGATLAQLARESQ